MSDGPRDTSNPEGGLSTGEIRSQYDWRSISPSTAVVETVAAATDRKPTDIDTRSGFPDPDALNALIRQAGPSGAPTDTTVSFTFAGHRVTVHSAGDVVVEPVRCRADHGQ